MRASQSDLIFYMIGLSPLAVLFIEWPLFNAHSEGVRPTGIFKFDYWPILCVIHALCMHMAHPFCATDQRCPLEIAARWYHLVWGAAHKLPARWVWSAESPFSQTFALIYILWLLTIPTRNSLFWQCISYIIWLWLQRLSVRHFLKLFSPLFKINHY